MNIITLFIAYLITPIQIKCQIDCPPGSDTTETINLDGALVDNEPAITSSLKGGPTECAGTQETDGWSYKNDRSCANSNDKVNWYFMGAVNDDDICNDPPGTDPWYECITPDIVNSAPGQGPNGHILVGCLQQIEFTLRGTIAADTDGIYIKVYTKPQQGDVVGTNSLRCWYKSRLHILPAKFNPQAIGATFNTFTTFTSVTLNDAGYAPLGTGNQDSNSGDNTNMKSLADILATEEIRMIAFSTNSGAAANTHDWTLLDFKLTFGDDCTCPTMRTYNLAAVPGPFSGIETTDIGNDCSDDIGTCDECTCKYKCIHQDGIENNIQQISNIDSQESCCALCSNTIGCLSYTYILHISGVSSECGEAYAINDCLLYNNKLTECNTDSTQMRYESVSGSIVNGICNINSIVGDCCQGNGECIMGSCTAPTAAPTAAPSDAPSAPPSNAPTLNPTNAPTLNPTSQTNNPTLSPTDSDDDSISSESEESEELESSVEALESESEPSESSESSAEPVESESSVEALEPEESDSSYSTHKPTARPTARPTDRPITRVVSEEESEEETDVNTGVDDDSDSGSSSDDDSGDDALSYARMKNKHGKYDIYNINNNTMIRYEEIIDMDVNLSESTWINIWGISGVIVIINVVLICIYYYKRKKIIQTLPLYR